jgi:transcriptional regulator with XRE-family HTH domain
MYFMVDNLSNFVDWVNVVMRERNITQADIAKTGYVTRAAVSALLVQRIKSVGVDMCRAIAAATGIPLATVYSKAGLLPPDPGVDPWVEEQKQVISELTGTRRNIAERLLQGLLDEERATYETNPRPANAAKHP